MNPWACLAACLLFAAGASARPYYVSTSGDDSNAGTFESPFKSISKAVGLVAPGDTIYLRGDTFAVSTTINLSRSGASGNMCYLLAYPGERAHLECSTMALGLRGINLTGSYWYIRGVDIARAGDNGMVITGSNNIVEFCSFCGNRDTGLQLYNGASNNRIINCDSFDNADPTSENADGFAPKLSVGSGNSFYGCRSWQNCDDGWDGYLRGADGVATTLEHCWSFCNGYLSNGSPSLPDGDGNGFKMGGSDNKDLAHTMVLRNCLAFDNRVKGYDQNNNKGSMTLLNCTAYRNGTNYSINQPLDSGQTVTVMNCVALGAYGSLAASAEQATNSWMNPFSVSTVDFISIDTNGARGPRKYDGSLPDIPFMRLAPGSDLIDAGTNVGIAYNGAAPDLGAYETEEPSAVRESASVAAGFLLFQNFPNPFNPKTVVSSWLRVASEVRLVVYDVLGRQVAVLVNERRAAGSYQDSFDATGLASGVYIYRLTAGSFVESRTMVILR